MTWFTPIINLFCQAPTQLLKSYPHVYRAPVPNQQLTLLSEGLTLSSPILMELDNFFLHSLHESRTNVLIHVQINVKTWEIVD